MNHREKMNKLMEQLAQDPWYQWVIKQPHKGIFPTKTTTGPAYFPHGNRIYVTKLDDWFNAGATLVVHELERRNTDNIGAFIAPRRIARFKWPSKMEISNEWKDRATKLARITDNDIHQADIDVMTARLLLRLKEHWDAGTLYRSTQVERRKAPRAKTDFATRGQGYTKWKSPTTEPSMTKMIPFEINSSK